MSGLLGWLLEPFHYAFMLRGLLAALIVGVACPVLGSYVVLRGMAFLGDALAHIILPGVVIAFLLGWPLTLGALVVGVLAALSIGALTRRQVIREDAAIGVVFAGAFALGIALLSAQRSYAVDLTHILFGNLLGVSSTDLVAMGLLGALVMMVVAALYKEFLVLSFDPVLAATLRLPAGFLHNLLLVLMAVVIVVAIQAVGVALVLAMLVTPASAAYILTRRLPLMMALAALIGALSAVVGLYLSFYMNIASGPAIVLVETAVFLLVFTLAPRRGALWARLRARKPALPLSDGAEPAVVVYGVAWCPDCRRARRLLNERQVPYRWVNVDKDPQASEYVKQVNRGMRSVPTLVFPNGDILVEPSKTELAKKLDESHQP